MVERHWKGTVKPGKAQSYISHLQHETFPHLEGIPGFMKASILKREVAEGWEFLIVTVWQSHEAISQFAGEPVDVAVVPAVAAEMMVRFDAKATHYAVEPGYERL